jgi:hydroxymethylglutaryl-CoA lyase
MKEFVRITEVGLRDGLQNQPHPVSTSGKLVLANSLFKAGLRYLETASFVHPKAVPQMADAAEVSAGISSERLADCMALVPNLKGYARAKAAGYQRVAVVISTTDTFNQRNLNMTRAETERVCQEVIQQGRADGMSVRAYVSGALGCPYDGDVPASIVHTLAQRMIEAGASDIAISDTIGAGNPRQIEAILKPLLAQYSPSLFSLHLHDTRGTALVNVWAGIESGVRHFDASIGGLGGCPFAPGATGNVATEDLVHLLHGAGFETGVNLDALYEAVAVAEEISQQSLGGRVTQWHRSQQRRAQQKAASCAPSDSRQ